MLTKSKQILLRKSITAFSRSFSIMHQNVSKYDPPVNRNMKVLDRAFFVKQLPLCVVKFPNPKHISEFAKQYKEYILRVPRIPHVIKLGNAKEDAESANNNETNATHNKTIEKGVLLTDSIQAIEDIPNVLTKEAMDFLQNANAEVLPYTYILDYNYWKAEDILKSVLPEEFLDEIPTGFTITGHIAHLNLRKEFKPYDSLIGQVILDKNTKIECVVDKVSSIATQFRTFPMKIIAGKSDNLIVEQKESNCTFKFDFSKVYWNSRLHTEHDRLVTTYFQPNEVVMDVMAGVGPFATPAGKKGTIVLANDLNPESYKYLTENIRTNKVDKFVKSYNIDGAIFIKNCHEILQTFISEHENGEIVVPIKLSHHERKRQKMENQSNDNVETRERRQPRYKKIKIPNEISHFVMNLPDSAIEFLHNFNSIYSKVADRNSITKMPWVHVHCFEKYGNDEEPTMEEIHKRVYKRILDNMKCTSEILPFTELQFHLVRKVSPTKPMFCVSFLLPREIAFLKNAD